MRSVLSGVVIGLTQVLVAGMAFAQSPAQWTFLVYLDGDNNLEGAAIGDFLEMASVGSSADVKIVALFDRISNYDDRYGNWTDARLGVINPGDVPDTSWGQSVGEANMGNPQTLIDFVEWGAQNHPASRYAVVLWDHGGGWRTNLEKEVFKAVCWDDSNGSDCLYMKEVRSALAAIETGGWEPDLVGFDACLMGMIEVAYEIREHAGVMVGSEETEPGDGWPYDTILQDLTATPSMDAAGLGTVIVDRYYQSYGNSEIQSAIDLTQMDALAADVDSLAQTLRDNWNSSVLACVTAAGSAMTAVDSAVIHERHGSNWSGSHGLAIYFPGSAGEFDPDYNGSIILFPGATRWEEFLQDYYSSMAGSWVQCARGRSQEFYVSAYIDLYDFCARLIACAPDDLGVQPTTDFISSGDEGGPFKPGCKSYTLTNVGSQSLNWEPTWTADWLDLTPSTGGTLSPAQSVTAEVCINESANGLPIGVYSDTVNFCNLTSGLCQRREVSLRVGQIDHFTESFDSSDNDLDNLTVTFVPDGSASFYRACTEDAAGFPTDPSGGTTLYLGDDAYVEVGLSGGAQVSLYGSSESVFYVGSNGYVTFGWGDHDYNESLEEHFSMRRISGLYDDLNPASGGTVSWKQVADRVAVTYENVPEYGAANPNSFQIEMFFSGTIRITWLGIAAADGIAGLSAGAGMPPLFLESDLSAMGACGPPEKAFNPDPPDGATHVSRTPELTWTAGVGATSHDVYFGATPGALVFQASQSGTTFEPGAVDPLDVLTPYYWRIDEVNGNGTTTGDVWTFTTRPGPGDFDGDRDVDMEDFGHLQACFTGPGTPATDPHCYDARLDSDLDVDKDDCSKFLQCLSGANVPADPDCAD